MPRGALKPSQERAIGALLVEPSVARAARAAGIGERTLHRWLRDDEAFLGAYRWARREAFGHAIGLTQRIAPHAVHTLASIMADGAAPYQARVAAATALLRFGRESIELDDLAARLEALERPRPVENRAVENQARADA
ncbi:MAG: hypothetical protein R3B68_15725 [Phycisphaerales bacterium]